MKPIVAHLHEKGIKCNLYIDDFYIQGSTFDECKNNLLYTCNVVKSLGFGISEKSNFIPSQVMNHLGFVLNSKDMTISLGGKKKDQIMDMINNIQSPVTVRYLAKIIGTLVASFPAVEYGPLFYRYLECQR